MTWLFIFRAVERAAIGTVSMSLALTLAVGGGLSSFTAFLAMAALGGAVGSTATYAASHRGASLRPAILLPAQAVALPTAAALPLITHATWPLALSGLALSMTSAPINAIVHSEASRLREGMRTRTRLTAATALGGAAGAATAGVVVDRQAYLVPLAISGVLLVALPATVARLRGVFTSERPVPDLTVDSPAPRDVFSIAWRLAVIANLAFAPALVAPGIVTATSGATIGGLASAGYQIGAVLTVPALAAMDGALSGRATMAFAQGASVFGLAALTLPLWLAVTGPPVAAVLVCLVMGIALFLIQTGFEQRGANLAAHVYAGPTVAVLHGVLALSGFGSVVLYPTLISHFGLPAVLWVSAASLAALGTVEKLRRRRRASQLVVARSTHANRMEH